MRHRKSGRKFNRNSSHRRAMFRLMAGNLFLHERIETTQAKAMEMRKIVEGLITTATRLGDDLTVDVSTIKDEGKRAQVLAKRLHARRQVASFIPPSLTRTLKGGQEVEEVDLVRKLFDDIAPRFMDRVKAGKGGGYTRVIKMIRRRGDNAEMAVLELLGRDKGEAEAAE